MSIEHDQFRAIIHIPTIYTEMYIQQKTTVCGQKLRYSEYIDE